MLSVVDFRIVDLGATENVSIMLANDKLELPIVLEQEWLEVVPNPVGLKSVFVDPIPLPQTDLIIIALRPVKRNFADSKPFCQITKMFSPRP